MIQSMTAFVRQECVKEWGRATWEIRSVNHRYLDVSMRLPEELRSLESKAREAIGKKLTRGRIDCMLHFEASTTGSDKLGVNTELAQQVIDTTKQIAEMMKTPAEVSPMDIMRWPGVLEGSHSDHEAVSTELKLALEEALKNLVRNRAREGTKLAELISTRVAESRIHARRVREIAPKIIEDLQQRLRTRLGELSVEPDEARLEQELVLLANKLDVSEELDRLETHLEEVERVLNTKGVIGRRLDFLMQELNREANTLGSKSAHVDTTGAVVELKVLIEQMREQIQNVE